MFMGSFYIRISVVFGVFLHATHIHTHTNSTVTYGLPFNRLLDPICIFTGFIRRTVFISPVFYVRLVASERGIFFGHFLFNDLLRIWCKHVAVVLFVHANIVCNQEFVL